MCEVSEPDACGTVERASTMETIDAIEVFKTVCDASRADRSSCKRAAKRLSQAVISTRISSEAFAKSTRLEEECEASLVIPCREESEKKLLAQVLALAPGSRHVI
jgi:hypothetical protein